MSKIRKKKEREEEKFTWKDFIAFTIALLQTTFLPIIIVIVVLIVIVLGMSIF